jgi:hypothetical protein
MNKKVRGDIARAAVRRISAANSEGLLRIAENTVSGISIVRATDIINTSSFLA